METSHLSMFGLPLY